MNFDGTKLSLDSPGTEGFGHVTGNLSLHQGPNSIRSRHLTSLGHQTGIWRGPQRVKGRSRRFIPSGLEAFLNLFWRLAEKPYEAQ